MLETIKRSTATRAVLLAAFAFTLCTGSAFAGEKKPLVYTSRIGPVVSRTVAPTGVPGHELVQTVRQDMTYSPDPDWNDVTVMNYGQSDMRSGTGTVTGHAVRTHRNGDKSVVSYRGNLRTVEEGGRKDIVGEGTLELTGGTGKFANARGKGTWRAARGESAVEMEVEY
ncbi:MAG: hypothetical protein IT532_01110 [Burkholderiales bacterium]|nr:hypothetical protein [Burkholderiales bacterium]